MSDLVPLLLPLQGSLLCFKNILFKGGKEERTRKANTQEGVEASADPAQVALVRARMLGLYLAPLVADGAIAWPGGLEAVAGAAREAMALAVELGADPSLPEELEDPLEAFEREHAEGHGHDHDH